LPGCRDDAQPPRDLCRPIVEVGKALKEAETQLGVCLQETLDMLLDHERRLQELENSDRASKLSLEEEFDFLQAQVERLGDSAKRVEGLSLLGQLREILGFIDELEDLEGA